MKCIVGAYSHLPAGSDNEEYNLLTERVLIPLLKTVYDTPSRKLVLRLGIHVFDWLENNHAEINMLIKNLCKSNRLELLSGTFHDSFPGLIPSYEISEQIEKTTTYLRKNFSRRPHGVWLNHQVFNPVVVSLLDKCALDYIFISKKKSDSQKLPDGPFYMDDIGRKSIIFPLNDCFSEIIQAAEGHGNTEKLFAQLQEYRIRKDKSIDSLFVNMDYLCKCDFSSSVFPFIFDNIASESVLPSELISDIDNLPYSYLSAGIYGADVGFLKEGSLNSHIMNTPFLCRRYSVLNIIRDISKSVKKNTDERKHLEGLLYKASPSVVYLPEFENNVSVQNLSYKYICEAEESLYNLNLIPESVQLNQPDSKFFPVCSKNYFMHIDEKSGSLSSLFLLNSYFDFCFNKGSGIFRDSFSQTTYTIEIFDKKKGDFILKSSVKTDHSDLEIEKHYRLRQNSLIFVIRIINKGKDNYSINYHLDSDISLPKKPLLQEYQACSQSLYSEGRNNPVNFSLTASDEFEIKAENIFSDYNSVIGVKSIYQYTHIVLSKNLEIIPQSDYECSFTLKLDKKKTGDANDDIK